MSADEKLCTCFAGWCERHVRLPDGTWKRYIPNPLHPLLPALPDAETLDWERMAMASQVAMYEKKRDQYRETPPTAEERAKEETEAFARGKRYSVSNAHATGCECPKCQPDIWIKEN